MIRYVTDELLYSDFFSFAKIMVSYTDDKIFRTGM